MKMCKHSEKNKIKKNLAGMKKVQANTIKLLCKKDGLHFSVHDNALICSMTDYMTICLIFLLQSTQMCLNTFRCFPVTQL